MIALSIQYADQEDTAEERGEASLLQAIDAFRAFPWSEQLAKANDLQICNPTLFLKDSRDGSVFFVALVLGAELDFWLFLETEEEAEVRTLFWKRLKRKRVVYESTGHDPEEVEAAIRVFYSDERSKLRKLVSG